MPFISFHVDAELLEQIRVTVLVVGETDRSKFIRAALREKIRLVNDQRSEEKPDGTVGKGCAVLVDKDKVRSE